MARFAAGIFVVARETGRVLLAKRNAGMGEPFTWALPGGGVERSETPADAAVRELDEEMHYRGKITLVPWCTIDQLRLPYAMFVGFVGREFKPKLNHEHVAAAWFPVGAWPRPLHPGLKIALGACGDDLREILTR